ncbi:MAG: MFS transporter [Phycisphaerae bacterium]|nr:MFS transporter [Phycisphaerae bacterium]
MSRLQRFLLVAFIESFACILVERGIYFFGTYRLGFSAVANLWLAVVFGFAYVVGAFGSHPLCTRWAEKRVLVLAIVAQVAFHALLAVSPTRTIVFVASTIIGYLNGAKWPVIESYISAGQTPAATARAVGAFNVAWAIAVPPSLVVVGPLIQLNASCLFVLAALGNLVTLWLVRPADRRPIHLPHDHPDRPAPEILNRLRRLLGFSRWIMFFSYAGLFAMAALMPTIFENDFRLSASVATPLSSVVDFMRLTAFVVLGATARWHMRWWPMIVATAALPVGFFLVAGGFGIAGVVVGEIVFGLAAGMIYYAALYYAMVVQNASVDAGGAHEGLIGLGFAVGPLACLMGIYLTRHFGAGSLFAIGAGMLPLFVLCTVGGVLRARQFTGAQTPLV